MTHNQATARAAGTTVREMIADLERQFPGMRYALCHETGEVRPHVNIFIGDVSLRTLQGLDTPLPEEAEVYILQAVSGGRAWGLGRRLQEG